MTPFGLASRGEPFMLGAMVRLPLFVALLLAFTACDRGPQPPAEDEAEEHGAGREEQTHRR